MDGKGANRNKFADIFLPDSTVKLLNMEMVKRLSEFPPNDTSKLETTGVEITVTIVSKLKAIL
ncbi:MAG: hypothetical protein WBA41_28630 [Rivularia sp. (in: cyanobacteria)]